jgi:hypothetical protein
MRNLLAGVAAVALLAGCMRPGFAVEVGDQVALRAACKGQAAIEQHYKLIVEDGNAAGSQTLLQEHMAAGECVALPAPMPAEVVHVGRSGVTEINGKKVRFTVIYVSLGGDGAWTLGAELAEEPAADNRPKLRGA